MIFYKLQKEGKTKKNEMIFTSAFSDETPNRLALLARTSAEGGSTKNFELPPFWIGRPNLKREEIKEKT